MKTPITEPLATGEPFAGTVALHENAITQRDALCLDAETLTTVSDDASLEAATAFLKDINALLKITEESRKKEKRPHIDFNKLVDDFAAKFTSPLTKAKDRITTLVNGFQRKQLEEKERRDREARAAAEKAQRDAEAAQREIERQQQLAAQATTKKEQQEAESKLLAAQLKQETAALTQQSAEATLAAPTNQPRGLVVKVRFDFEVLAWIKFITTNSAFWRWDRAAEILKVDRARIIKDMNAGDYNMTHDWLPAEAEQSINLPDIGLRVYRDIRSSTRA